MLESEPVTLRQNWKTKTKTKTSSGLWRSQMLGLVVIVEFLLGKHQCIASTVELDQNQIKGEWPHQEVGSHLVSLIKTGN